MLITKEVEILLGCANTTYYESLGYYIPRRKDKQYKMTIPKGTKIKVKVCDLQKGSNALVEVKCDCPNCKNPFLKPITYRSYLNGIEKYGKYYCMSCSNTLFGVKKRTKIILENGKSFEQWCIDNNKQDVLDRWDYKLNDCLPCDVCQASKGYNNKGYWFKCLKHAEHKSELKSLINFTNGEYVMFCKQCNSIAQWGIDNLGEDFLDKYWDWNKNGELGINPWTVQKGSAKPKVWLKCQNPDKPYHGSYDISCCNFTGLEQRCTYCTNKTGKVHPLDSLGTLFPDVLKIWGSKNNKTPYEFTPKSKSKVFWKCPEKNHEDFKRSIHGSQMSNFRCPECQYSKGEKRIEKYLKSYKIDYIPQKEYDGLIGLGYGNLSYDFYLPNYNLLIEYQGEFHDGSVSNQRKEDLKKQQEHDRRKRRYALKNNIKLLEIWYWDFDNIEVILDKELSIKMEVTL